MRKLFFCLMLGLVVILAGCDKDDETSGDVNNGDGGMVDPMSSITLDHVDGSPADGQITAGGDVVFHLRLKNAAAIKAKGITNGFKIYSPDGATWTNTVGDTTGTLGKADFDLIVSINQFSVTGDGADTIGFGCSVMTGPGLAPGFDDIAYTITIGPINTVGKNVCVDSAYYRPTHTWLWAYGEGSFPPTWDGPHCFTVVE